MATQLNEQEIQYAQNVSEHMSKLPASGFEAGIAVLRYKADAEIEARDRQVSLDDVNSVIGQVLRVRVDLLSGAGCPRSVMCRQHVGRV